MTNIKKNLIIFTIFKNSRFSDSSHSAGVVSEAKTLNEGSDAVVAE